MRNLRPVRDAEGPQAFRLETFCAAAPVSIGGVYADLPSKHCRTLVGAEPTTGTCREVVVNEHVQIGQHRTASERYRFDQNRCSAPGSAPMPIGFPRSGTFDIIEKRAASADLGS